MKIEHLDAMVQALDRLDPQWRTAQAARTAKNRLLAMTQDARSSTRMHAGTDDPAVLELFRAALHDEDPFTRSIVAEMLAEKGDPDAVNCLISLLESSDVSIQDRAARVLGHLKVPRAFGALYKIAADEKRPFWTNIVWALGELGDTRAVPVLARLLMHDEEQIGSVAAAALRTIASVGMRPEAIEEVLRELGFLLEDEDGAALNQALRAAGFLQEPLFVPQLLRIAERSDPASPEAMPEIAASEGSR